MWRIHRLCRGTPASDRAHAQWKRSGHELALLQQTSSYSVAAAIDAAEAILSFILGLFRDARHARRGEQRDTNSLA